MARWLEALSRTRQRLANALVPWIRPGSRPDAASLEDVEEQLLQADVPVRLVARIVQTLNDARSANEAERTGRLRDLLVASCGPAPAPGWMKAARPAAVLVVGINGSGKTTTCAKLAHRAQKEGLRPLLGATDTFRAAGADQLRLWAERLRCPVVAGATGADAAAVAFDALDAAVARNVDVVFLDTAGRMHTRQPLMHELQKIQRALDKRLPGKPDDTWLVLDGSMGQNAITQARVFHEAVALTGAVITKLDGSAKAGFVFGIGEQLGIPLCYVGLGEGPDDLEAFNPAAFVDALLDLDVLAREQPR